MHTIQLKVQDSAYEHIMFFLKNIGKKNIEILGDDFVESSNLPKTKQLEELFLRSNNKIMVTKDLAIDTDGLSE